MSLPHDPLKTHSELTDGVLLLRLPRSADAPALTGAVKESLPELRPWMDWAGEAYDLAAAQRWLEFAQQGWAHSTAFHFAITDAATGEYIGNCGIDGLNLKEHLGNLGYWVRTGRTRQGIASRAARLAAGFGFDRIALSRLDIVIAAGNTASQRAAEKAGAHFGGIRRKPLVVHTDVHAAVVYTLTATDLQPG
jgi:ribosomal-protein-serine acetyltransferase